MTSDPIEPPASFNTPSREIRLGSVLESEEPLPRNASDGCAFINGCNLMPPLLDEGGAGENPAGASRGGGGGDAVLEEFRHNSHSSDMALVRVVPALLPLGGGGGSPMGNCKISGFSLLWSS